MKIDKAFWLLPILFCFGCASHHAVLFNHPKSIVSVPALVGTYTGFVAGLPVAIVASPITYPIALSIDDPLDCTTAPILLSPALAVGWVGSEITGRPFWLVFGWWGEGGLAFIPNEKAPTKILEDTGTSEPDPQN
jgi:hypothetical protein